MTFIPNLETMSKILHSILLFYGHYGWGREATHYKTNGFQVILKLSEDFIKPQELTENYISYPEPLDKRKKRLKTN